jgi:5-hydroxyisourate hydrolase
MGRLTTHVLDTARGQPAAGVKIEFSVLDGTSWKPLKTVSTNADGRTDEPLMTGEAMQVGQFQLLFHIGDYFRRSGVALADPPFIDCIPLQFGIADINAHYHVPLLASPFAYSTYRGS